MVDGKGAERSRFLCTGYFVNLDNHVGKFHGRKCWCRFSELRHLACRRTVFVSGRSSNWKCKVRTGMTPKLRELMSCRSSNGVCWRRCGNRSRKAGRHDDVVGSITAIPLSRRSACWQPLQVVDPKLACKGGQPLRSPSSTMAGTDTFLTPFMTPFSFFDFPGSRHFTHGWRNRFLAHQPHGRPGSLLHGERPRSSDSA